MLYVVSCNSHNTNNPVILGVTSVIAETVTFYSVQPAVTGLPTADISISKLGVGSDGATTYLEVIKDSAVAFPHVGSSTTTLSTITFPVVTLEGSNYTLSSSSNWTNV
jgi:hypothetical protein